MASSLTVENRETSARGGGRRTGENRPRELLSGIDSLDLTCKTPVPGWLVEQLMRDKAAAGEDRRRPVLLDVGGEPLRVAESGMGAWWPLRLEHRFGNLGLGSARNRPAWRVSLAAEALHTEGPARVVEFFRDIIGRLTDGPVSLSASRLDVHADFAGLGIVDDDRKSFVCRSRRQSVEFAGEDMETLYFGKGGAVVTRIYDKLAEVKASGKGDYLMDLYRVAGLREGESVQRVEGQVRREALREMGVVTAEDALSRAGEVYAYVTGKWLRLVDSSTATRAERAAVDPRWAAVQAASIAAGLDAARRVQAVRGLAGLDVIVPMINGLMVAAGVGLGIADPANVLVELGRRTAEYRDRMRRDFATEVRGRRLDFSSNTNSSHSVTVTERRSSKGRAC